jgi:hypothetical protein
MSRPMKPPRVGTEFSTSGWAQGGANRQTSQEPREDAAGVLLDEDIMHVKEEGDHYR